VLELREFRKVRAELLSTGTADSIARKSQVLELRHFGKIKAELCSTSIADCITGKIQMLELRSLRKERAELCKASITGSVAGKADNTPVTEDRDGKASAALSALLKQPSKKQFTSWLDFFLPKRERESLGNSGAAQAKRRGEKETVAIGGGGGREERTEDFGLSRSPR